MNDQPMMDQPPTVREAVVELVVQVMELHAMVRELQKLTLQGALLQRDDNPGGWRERHNAFLATSASLDSALSRTFGELQHLASRMITPDA